MKNKLKIIEWNINKRSKSGPINPVVIAQLLEEDAFANILVEYKIDNDFEKKLTENNYHVFTKINNSGNDVLITIKNKYKCYNVNYIPVPEAIDILSIGVNIEGKEVCIIGARIRTGDCSKQDYCERVEHQKELLKYVKDIENYFDEVIVLGDFNHAQIYQTKNNYKGRAQEQCSYHRFKEEIEEMQFSIFSPSGYDTNSSIGPIYKKEDENKTSFSWVGKYDYGNYYVALDHVFASNGVKVTEVEYDWNFLKKIGREEEKSKYKSDQITYPDHAMLVVTIEL